MNIEGNESNSETNLVDIYFSITNIKVVLSLSEANCIVVLMKTTTCHSIAKICFFLDKTQALFEGFLYCNFSEKSKE